MNGAQHSVIPAVSAAAMSTTVAGETAASPSLSGTSARTPPLVRFRAAAVQLAPQVQYRITRLGISGQAGLAALIAAAVLAASVLIPAQRTLQTLTAQLAAAGHAPVAASVDQTVPHLLASLPSRAQMPEVIGLIFAQAREAGVSLDTGHYVYAPAKGGTIARYELEFPVKAGYPDIRGFIDRTLASVPAVGLGKLRFERKAVGDAVVGADIVFVVFVRGGEQP